MAGRNNYERNPLKMVIYILAVIFFIGCIGYLLKYSGMEKEEYQKEVERVSALESSSQTDGEKKSSSKNETKDDTKEESSESSGKEKNNKSDLTTKSEEKTSDPTSAPETANLTPAPDAAALSETPAPDAANQTPTPEVKQQADAAVNAVEANILVLNGTKRPGVAGYWKTELEKAGYKNVTPVTYTKAVGLDTIICTDNAELAQPLLALFPGAQIQEGSVQDGIELEAGVTLPEKCDIYIIIGEKDIRM